MQMIQTKFKCPVCGEIHTVKSELKTFEDYTLLSNNGEYYFWIEDRILCKCGLTIELDTEDNAEFGNINIRCYRRRDEQ